MTFDGWQREMIIIIYSRSVLRSSFLNVIYFRLKVLHFVRCTVYLQRVTQSHRGEPAVV